MTGQRFFAAIALSVLLALTWNAWSYSDTPATGPTSAPAALDFQPITYFQDNCARCHGSYGSTYTPGMARRYTVQTLRDKIDAMAGGPAQAPLDAAQLDEVLAYQISLNDGKPFVTVQRVALVEGGSREVTGEATPGTKVVVSSGAAHADATVDGHAWTARLPGGADAVRVTAGVGDSSTEATVGTPDRSEK